MGRGEWADEGGRQTNYTAKEPQRSGTSRYYITRRRIPFTSSVPNDSHGVVYATRTFVAEPGRTNRAVRISRDERDSAGVGFGRTPFAREPSRRVESTENGFPSGKIDDGD